MAALGCELAGQDPLEGDDPIQTHLPGFEDDSQATSGNLLE